MGDALSICQKDSGAGSDEVDGITRVSGYENEKEGRETIYNEGHHELQGTDRTATTALSSDEDDSKRPRLRGGDGGDGGDWSSSERIPLDEGSQSVRQSSSSLLRKIGSSFRNSFKRGNAVVGLRASTYDDVHRTAAYNLRQRHQKNMGNNINNNKKKNQTSNDKNNNNPPTRKSRRNLLGLRNSGGKRNSGSSNSLSASTTTTSTTTAALPPIGVVGLHNLGNTCFLNSSLQCLSATIPLTDYFLGYDYQSEINRDNPLGTGGKLAMAYAQLMTALWLDSTTSNATNIKNKKNKLRNWNNRQKSDSTVANTAVRPTEFKAQLGQFAPQFQGYQQHDAQELLALLLDGIHEDLNRVKQKPYIEDRDCNGKDDEKDAMEAWKNYLLRNKSIIVDIFQGQMKSTLQCLVCGHVNVRFEPFMYLSLPIADGSRSLEDCMELYLAPEILRGENQWYCSQCKAHVDARKKTDLWILPPILIVHLKRFRFDDEYGSVQRGSKNSTAVQFPIRNWDLRSYVKSRASAGCSKYDLYAVSNHIGGLGSGHYTAYAQARFEEEGWYEFNDSQTSRITEDTLRENASSAYVLFYNRTTAANGTKINCNDYKANDMLEKQKTKMVQIRNNQDEVNEEDGFLFQPRPIPLVRRQSTNRPDLWPHTQVQDLGSFRSFSRSSLLRVSVVDGSEEDDEEDEENIRQQRCFVNSSKRQLSSVQETNDHDTEEERNDNVKQRPGTAKEERPAIEIELQSA